MSLSVTKGQVSDDVSLNTGLTHDVVSMAESVVNSTISGIAKLENRHKRTRDKGPTQIKVFVILEGGNAAALALNPGAPKYLHRRFTEVAEKRGRDITYSCFRSKRSFKESLKATPGSLAYGDIFVVHASDNGSTLIHSNEELEKSVARLI